MTNKVAELIPIHSRAPMGLMHRGCDISQFQVSAQA
jgi:hypothetical protein